MHSVILIRSNPVRPYPRLEKMANCLIKNGHKVHILAWDRDNDYNAKTEVLTLPSGTVNITRIGIKGQFSGGVKKNLKGLLGFQRFIKKWLYENKNSYDVIHAYDFDTGFTASRCAKRLCKKFIYDIPDYYVDSHGLKDTMLGKLIKRSEDSIISNADATIICTEERREQIRDASPRELVVIHNTPNIEENGNLHYVESDKLRIVYVGILGRTRFIDKIAEVVAERNDCEFHIAGFGGGLEEYFKKKAEECDRIFFYGRLSYNQAIELEYGCDVMTAIYDPKVPNHYYAAPNKFYEALALGKPIIMARNTGMSKIVEANGIGVLIDYNTESLNEALDFLIQKKQDWDKISKKSKELYNKFSWKTMEQRIKQLYMNI